MKLEEIIQLVNNKRNILNDRKNSAFTNGDMDEYYRFEEELREAEKILEKLKS